MNKSVPPPPSAPRSTPPVGDAHALLNRPVSERLREHKYRFSQALVFGLPVLGLEWFGRGLGGEASAVWVAALGALLAGWVVYVAATGMLIESLLLRRPTADAAVGAVALILYLLSLALTFLMLLGQVPPFNSPFHWPVLLLVAWTGTQWWRLARLAARAAPENPRRSGD